MGVISGVSRGNYATNHFVTCSYCKSDRECFARTYGRCAVLTPGPDGKFEFGKGGCPFKKRDREVTDGKVYPHRDKK